MSRIKKTILHIEVNDSEFKAQYTGQFDFPPTKEAFKHNERLMRMLASDETMLNFFYNLVNPVVRMKRREARKKPTESKSNESLTKD